MEPALIPLLTVLMFVSAMFAVVLVMAWGAMGRPDHALTWAMAFALGAVGWMMNLAEGTLFVGNALYFVASGVPLLGSLMLAVVGYRQRSGMPVRKGLLWAIAILVTATTAGYAMWWKVTGMSAALIPLCAATMFPVSIHAIWTPPGRRSPAERASIAVLALFTLFECVITILALRIGNERTPAADAAYDLYAISLFAGLPTLYIALGVAALFLLMADQTVILDRLVRHDGMTGLLNRSGFREAAAASLHSQPNGCIVVGDIDHFKRINDQWGHAVGDLAITSVADAFRGNLRKADIVGRIGGEEFAIVLPLLDEGTAGAFVDRLRLAVTHIRIQAHPDIRLTMSFGVALLKGREKDLDAILSLADHSLYEAKSRGRNQVCIAA